MSLADRDGAAGLTMRALAAELGVKAMSLYHHLAGKEAVLDALVDVVFAEMDAPRPGRPWRAEVRRRCLSARAVLLRHPWALGLLDTRTSPGPASLAHHDAMLGTLRGDGFDAARTGLAYAMIDAYVYGFVMQEIALPFEGGGDAADVAEGLVAALADGRYPHLVEFVTDQAMRPDYAFGAHFEPGLDLLLDTLDKRVRGG